MRLPARDDRFPPAAEPSPVRRMPRVLLEIRRGAARHRLRPVAGPVYLIGAAPECDLVLGDAQFPEFYAYLLVSGGRVRLRRVGAGPEITVEGRPVEAVELMDGDRLRTGPFEFRLHLAGGPDGPHLPDPDHRPQPVRRKRPRSETPAAMVQALLADVRARLAGPDCLPHVPLPTPPRRDAA